MGQELLDIPDVPDELQHRPLTRDGPGPPPSLPWIDPQLQHRPLTRDGPRGAHHGQRGLGASTSPAHAGWADRRSGPCSRSPCFNIARSRGMGPGWSAVTASSTPLQHRPLTRDGPSCTQRIVCADTALAFARTFGQLGVPHCPAARADPPSAAQSTPCHLRECPQSSPRTPSSRNCVVAGTGRPALQLTSGEHEHVVYSHATNRPSPHPIPAPRRMGPGIASWNSMVTCLRGYLRRWAGTG